MSDDADVWLTVTFLSGRSITRRVPKKDAIESLKLLQQAEPGAPAWAHDTEFMYGFRVDHVESVSAEVAR